MVVDIVDVNTVISHSLSTHYTLHRKYFSTWAGFIITIFLLVECYQGVAEAQTAIHGNGVERMEPNMTPMEEILRSSRLKKKKIISKRTMSSFRGWDLLVIDTFAVTYTHV